MTNKILICIFLVLLAACNGADSETKKPTSEAKKPELSATEKAALEVEKAKAEAKTAVLSGLKDPDSAKFGEFAKIGDKFACLGVNARNSFGGYTGEQQASLIKQEGKWAVLTIDKQNHETCVLIMGKIFEEQTRKATHALSN